MFIFSFYSDHNLCLTMPNECLFDKWFPHKYGHIAIWKERINHQSRKYFCNSTSTLHKAVMGSSRNFKGERLSQDRVFIFVLLMLASFSVSISNACPTQCSCANTIVDCTHQSLASLPSGIPATTERLNLQNNKLATLTTDMFSGLTSLQ